MGKISAAKKKQKRKDFQKVKFKVGKKLPKNLNETRATFKAKTLILKQQFQLDKEGPVSHRNLSWKELLAHLGHYNASIKLDAINSLKEMIVANNDLIQLEFNNLLENMCPLFTDRDYKIREASMQLFKTLILLPYFSNKAILIPFYNLINVHLSCAMTHSVENIQYTSLKLLDILVENLPDLVRMNAYSVFDNFIAQISNSNLKGNKRQLKNDPYKLTSTQTWRHNVLSRLYKMLVIVSASFSKNSKNSTISEHSQEENIQLDFFNNKTREVSKLSIIPINFDSSRQCLITLNSNLNENKSSIRIWLENITFFQFFKNNKHLSFL